MVNYAVETYGALYILVNNAGIEIVRSIHEMTEEEWDSVMNVNMKGVFFVAKHSAQKMLRIGTF